MKNIIQHNGREWEHPRRPNALEKQKHQIIDMGRALLTISPDLLSPENEKKLLALAAGVAYATSGDGVKYPIEQYRVIEIWQHEFSSMLEGKEVAK